MQRKQSHYSHNICIIYCYCYRFLCVSIGQHVTSQGEGKERKEDEKVREENTLTKPLWGDYVITGAACMTGRNCTSILHHFAIEIVMNRMMRCQVSKYLMWFTKPIWIYRHALYDWESIPCCPACTIVCRRIHLNWMEHWTRQSHDILPTLGLGGKFKHAPWATRSAWTYTCFILMVFICKVYSGTIWL